MSDQPQRPAAGAIIHTDLTVPDAENILGFYQAVAGWQAQDVPMTDEDGTTYTDHNLTDASGKMAVGLCHRRGMNADLPAVWMIYVQVADLAASLERCTALGGSILKQMNDESGAPVYAVIRDPAGAYLALVPTSPQG